MTVPASPIVESALSLVDGRPDDAVEELLALAGQHRSPLEATRDALVARLHRRSDDFAAAQALQLVERALAQVGWGENVLPELRAAERHPSPSLRSRFRDRRGRRRRSGHPIVFGPRPQILGSGELSFAPDGGQNTGTLAPRQSFSLPERSPSGALF